VPRVDVHVVRRRGAGLGLRGQDQAVGEGLRCQPWPVWGEEGREGWAYRCAAVGGDAGASVAHLLRCAVEVELASLGRGGGGDEDGGAEAGGEVV